MYDPEFEAMSLDEAYLDVTHLVSSSSGSSQVTPLSIANEIRERVLHATGLTCSVGAAANKLIAKICRSSNTQLSLLFARFSLSFTAILIENSGNITTSTAAMLKSLTASLSSRLLSMIARALSSLCPRVEYLASAVF
jgi:hypothetical protein